MTEGIRVFDGNKYEPTTGYYYKKTKAQSYADYLRSNGIKARVIKIKAHDDYPTRWKIYQRYPVW